MMKHAIIRFDFCDIQNNQGHGKGYQLMVEADKFLENLNITENLIRSWNEGRSHHFSGFTNSIYVATSHVNLRLGIFVHHRRSCKKHSRVSILQELFKQFKNNHGDTRSLEA